MVKLQDVFKTYDNGTKALRGVSLTIQDGEFVFIVGPSGSGKSTIIKMLTAELRPTSGKVQVGDYDIGSIRQRDIPYLRRTIGVVFQDFRLIENKTVYYASVGDYLVAAAISGSEFSAELYLVTKEKAEKLKTYFTE